MVRELDLTATLVPWAMQLLQPPRFQWRQRVSAAEAGARQCGKTWPGQCARNWKERRNGIKVQHGCTQCLGGVCYAGLDLEVRDWTLSQSSQWVTQAGMDNTVASLLTDDQHSGGACPRVLLRALGVW